MRPSSFLALGWSLSLSEVGLRAALPGASALARPALEVVNRLAAGEWTFPAEDRALMRSLFVMAAARVPEAWPVFKAALRRGDRCYALFGCEPSLAAGAIALCYAPAHTEELLRLPDDERIAPECRSGLLGALARLVRAGGLPAQDLEELLLRRAASARGMDEPDRNTEAVLIAEAVIHGGLATLADLPGELWTKAALTDEDRARIAADAGMRDLTFMDKEGLCAFDDPAKGLADELAMEAEAPDPGASVDLDFNETLALADWLAAQPAPRDIEWLDGYLTAAMIGPDRPERDELLGAFAISAEDETPGADFIIRRAAAIIMRSGEELGLSPTLIVQHERPPGLSWGLGFEAGVTLRARGWEPLLRVEGLDFAYEDLVSLADPKLPPEERLAILDEADEIIGAVADFFNARRNRAEQERAPKIGRNEPCPCGSGQKWKKCCGAAA